MTPASDSINEVIDWPAAIEAQFVAERATDPLGPALDGATPSYMQPRLFRAGPLEPKGKTVGCDNCTCDLWQIQRWSSGKRCSCCDTMWGGVNWGVSSADVAAQVERERERRDEIVLRSARLDERRAAAERGLSLAGLALGED